MELSIRYQCVCIDRRSKKFGQKYPKHRILGRTQKNTINSYESFEHLGHMGKFSGFYSYNYSFTPVAYSFNSLLSSTYKACGEQADIARIVPSATRSDVNERLKSLERCASVYNLKLRLAYCQQWVKFSY